MPEKPYYFFEDCIESANLGANSIAPCYSYKENYGTMVQQQFYNAYSKVTPYQKDSIVKFLQQNLDGDEVSREAIVEAMDYAVKDRPSFGGFILTANESDKILGAMVVNSTGLEVNPSNRVVYMAIADQYRGNGVASKLMKRAIELSKGKLALQVSNNPESIRMFEQLGFQTKYVELRLSKV